MIPQAARVRKATINRTLMTLIIMLTLL